MTRRLILGGETGDTSELPVVGDVQIESTVVNNPGGKGGAFSYKLTSTGSDTTQGTYTTQLNNTHVFVKQYFRLSDDSAPSGTIDYRLYYLSDGSGGINQIIQLEQAATGVFTLQVLNHGAAVTGSAVIPIVKDTWYRLDVDVTNGAGTGATTVYIGGVAQIILTAQDFNANNIRIMSSGQIMTGVPVGRILYQDDIEVDDAVLCGESYVIARQFKVGIPTYDSWNKF